MITKITRHNISAPAGYVDDVRYELTQWGFSRELASTDWALIQEVVIDGQKPVVAAAAIAEARINRFNARGRK